MTKHRDELALSIVLTDNTFEPVVSRGARVWLGKCIHCGRKKTVSHNGSLLDDSTIEHIKPRSRGGTDDAANLAIACRRCNNEKGIRHDNKKNSRRAEEIVQNLLARRKERWRDEVNIPDWSR